MIVRIACALLLLVGAVGLLAPQPRSSELVTPTGDRLVVLAAEQPKGVVLIVHSVFQDLKTALPIARAMHRAGFTAIAVKLQPGRSFHDYRETLRGVCDQFQKEGPLYLVGHSMGADLVSSLAGDDARIASVVTIGFPVETSLLECPVTLAAGAWDQVHSRSRLEAAAGEHRLLISPFSDHSQETLDPYLWRHIAEIFGAQLRLLPWPNRILSEGLFVLGLWGLLLRFAPWPEDPRKAGLLVFILVAVLGFGHRWWSSPLTHPTMLSLWLALAAHNGWKDEVSPVARSLVRWGALGALCVAVSWALHSYEHVLAQPSLLLGLPVAVLSWVPIVLVRASSLLFYDVPGTTGLGPAFLALLLLEIVVPGRLVGALTRGARTLAGRLQQAGFEGTARPTAAQCAVLVLLLGVAALLWQNVKRAGYVLDTGDLLRLAWKFTVLLGLPALLMAVALRRSGPTPGSTPTP